MIEITVKTLDSANHPFSVPDDIVVKDFKETIAASVNVPASSQRLIYCGRVLQDDKKLSEYDVNGKVIHLVQRAPPTSQSGDGAGGGGSEARRDEPRRAPQWNAVFQPSIRMDGGNAMYLGAMAFPREFMRSQDVRMDFSRLGLVRSMIRRAAAVLCRLESQQQQANNPSDSSDSSPSANSDEDQLDSNIVEPSASDVVLQPVAAEEVTRISSVPTLDNTTDEVTEDEAVIEEVVVEDANDVPPSVPTGQDTAPDVTSTPTGNRDNLLRNYRTSSVAVLLDELARINTRLAPFLQTFHELMRDDPELEPTEATRAQRVFNQVSEVMHLLSHAYHALSDVRCDWSQAPPRTMSGRPVLMQRSAVLQTGSLHSIPLQINWNELGTGGPGQARQANAAPAQFNMDETQQNGAQAEPTVDATQPNAATAHPEAEATPLNVPGFVNEVSSTTMPEENRNTQQQQQQQQHGTVADYAVTTDAIMQLTGFRGFDLGSQRNFEVFMDVVPGGSITFDSIEATVLNSPSTPSSSDANSAGSGGVTWGTQSPFELPQALQNLFHVLHTGHQMGSSGHTTQTAQSGTAVTTAGPAAGSNNVAGQNSQARGNTATHPTTATQTRSTPRPHVQLAEAHSVNFDPFLPCNSHHIRVRRSRSSGASAAPGETGQARTRGTQESTRRPNRHDEIRSTMLGANLTTSVSMANDSIAGDPMAASRAGASNASSNGRGGGSQATSLEGPPVLSSEFVSSLMSEVFSAISQAQQSQMQAQQGEVPNQFSLNVPTISVINQLFLQGSDDAPRPSATVADFLRTLPGQTYTEGESLFMDIFMTLARSMTMLDIMNLGLGQSEVLSRTHPRLREFVTQRLLLGQPYSEMATRSAVNRINAEMKTHIDILECEVHFRPDIDFFGSISQLHHAIIPKIIEAIMEQDDVTFRNDLLSHCRAYARQFCAILLHCNLDGIQGLDNVFRSLVQRMTTGLPRPLYTWTVTSSVTNMSNYLSSIDMSYYTDIIRPYLVYRAAATPQDCSTLPSQVQNQIPNLHPEPMETEFNVTEATPPKCEKEKAIVTANAAAPILAGPIAVAESLPDVIIGSADWHAALPPQEWVPIITRDTQRQKKANPQPPLSDAYLTGMPSKRRKLITAVKPSPNPDLALQHGLGSALNAVGPGAGSIAGRSVSDPLLQTVYREEVQTALRDNLRSHPDYTPQRYPTSAKYFDK